MVMYESVCVCMSQFEQFKLTALESLILQQNCYGPLSMILAIVQHHIRGSLHTCADFVR